MHVRVIDGHVCLLNSSLGGNARCAQSFRITTSLRSTVPGRHRCFARRDTRRGLEVREQSLYGHPSTERCPAHQTCRRDKPPTLGLCFLRQKMHSLSRRRIAACMSALASNHCYSGNKADAGWDRPGVVSPQAENSDSALEQKTGSEAAG